jgi:hypothetical protein
MDRDNLQESATNRKKIEQLQGILSKALERVLRRGFHGTLRFELTIRDGTIQEIQEHTTVRYRKET